MRPMGGPTFIENAKNGFLIAEDDSKTRDELIENISEAIIKYYELDQDVVTKHSYAIASNYLDETVADKWIKVLKIIIKRNRK